MDRAAGLSCQTCSARRESDRLGLIVFGAAAYLQTPFTDDHQVWRQLLSETEIGMAGPSTVFGDAIGTPRHVFPSLVMIVLGLALWLLSLGEVARRELPGAWRRRDAGAGERA